MTYMWRLEGNFVELVIYLDVISGDHTRGNELYGQHFYTMSQLAGP